MRLRVKDVSVRERVWAFNRGSKSTNRHFDVIVDDTVSLQSSQVWSTRSAIWVSLWISIDDSFQNRSTRLRTAKGQPRWVITLASSIINSSALRPWRHMWWVKVIQDSYYIRTCVPSSRVFVSIVTADRSIRKKLSLFWAATCDVRAGEGLFTIHDIDERWIRTRD